MDLGLNRLTPAEFRAIFENSGSWRCRHPVQPGDNRLFAVFNALRRVEPVEKFFTTSIYAVARKAR